MSCPADLWGGATKPLRMCTAIGLAALALVAVLLLVAACGDGNQEATPSPTPSPTPGPPPETLFDEALNGVPVKLDYQPASGTYVATVSGVTIERYREGKAALEERLPSLVPDPCLVRWTTPILLIDELEEGDLTTSGCQ
jgi:hypothetical protein